MKKIVVFLCVLSFLLYMSSCSAYPCFSCGESVKKWKRDIGGRRGYRAKLFDKLVERRAKCEIRLKTINDVYAIFGKPDHVVFFETGRQLYYIVDGAWGDSHATAFNSDAISLSFSVSWYDNGSIALSLGVH
jgi:hypothetical protein